MFSLILLMIFIGIVGAAAFVIFSRYLDRDARYERRLRHRNKVDWEKEKLRQERLLEARMSEIHGKGLKWNEENTSEPVENKSWSRSHKERIPGWD